MDGTEFKLRLPNLWDLAASILSCGKGALLYKVDLSRAYRQLRSCPLDWPFLAVHCENETFVDIAVPFGLRHHALACQCTTEAVATIMEAEMGAHTHLYIDDTAGAAGPGVADRHCEHLLSCMDDLGLEAALEKCSPPLVCMIWIGVIFNALTLMMRIEPGRVEKVLRRCR